jgi:endonuclease/exonuclease/phosphatase family metal-dependent hydrolase
VKVRVASYNVHRFVGTDGVRDLPRMARVLRELDADVVALQEVAFEPGQDQPIELLAALTGYRALAAPIDRRDGMRHGNVLLTRLPVVSSRRICLDYETHEPRTAVEAWLETGGRPLRVVATHLGLRPGERRFQVRVILERVAGDEKSVTVLLGDFNEWFLAGRPLRCDRFPRGSPCSRSIGSGCIPPGRCSASAL